jgi:hypothetical protein
LAEKEDEIPLAKGDLEHIKGFIVNKLYSHGCWISVKGSTGKHLKETDLPKGYERGKLKFFPKAVKELRNERIIEDYPSPGDGKPHYRAIKSKEAIQRGLVYRNKWAMTEKLPIWKIEDFYKG